jgi:hypothetical protein
MNPGLPGLGIGGLFYIVCGLALPAIAIWRKLAGRPAYPARVRLAIQQFAIASGIIGNLALAFWLLEIFLVVEIVATVATGPAELQWYDVRLYALALTSAVLLFVLGAMHALRLYLPKAGGKNTLS